MAFVSSTRVTPLTAKIVIRSTGLSGTSSQTVEAQIAKIYDLADGAIGLRGAETGVTLTGNSFFVSGFDYDPISGAPVVGSVGTPLSVMPPVLKLRAYEA